MLRLYIDHLEIPLIVIYVFVRYMTVSFRLKVSFHNTKRNISIYEFKIIFLLHAMNSFYTEER